jgi:heme/copper-type cytochrome/quinol oxidase subunit 2
MSGPGRTLWIIVKVFILLGGVGAVGVGGFCGAITAPAAWSHDALAREIFTTSAMVFLIGLTVAVTVGVSLWRDRRAAKVALEAELEAIRQQGRPQSPPGGHP